MAIKHTVFFVIRPTMQLQLRLNEISLPAKDVLLEPVLWTFSQDESAWPAKMVQDAVKCIFIAYLKYDLLRRDGDELGLDISGEFFDRFWEVEHFRSYDDRVEDVIGMLGRVGALEKLKQIDNPIIRVWIEALQK